MASSKLGRKASLKAWLMGTLKMSDENRVGALKAVKLSSATHYLSLRENEHIRVNKINKFLTDWFLCISRGTQLFQSDK